MDACSIAAILPLRQANSAAVVTLRHPISAAGNVVVRSAQAPMAARIGAVLVVVGVGLVASTAALAQDAKVSDLRHFTGHWRRAESTNCQSDLTSNILVRPKEIIGYHGTYSGVTICRVTNWRASPHKAENGKYRFKCQYTMGDGKSFAGSLEEILMPIANDKFELWSNGYFNGVYAKCPSASAPR
jgi:hypothetical protein